MNLVFRSDTLIMSALKKDFQSSYFQERGQVQSHFCLCFICSCVCIYAFNVCNDVWDIPEFTDQQFRVVSIILGISAMFLHVRF